jgi:polar amino acid transport system substrate-binding protein
MAFSVSVWSIIARCLIGLLLITDVVFAQSASEAGTEAPLPQGEITVATRVIAPFVIRDGEDLSGFSVELWRAIAAELGLKSRFVVYDNLPSQLESVRDHKNMAGISAISITSERTKTLDFSQPMFRSGLSIMVPSNQSMNILSIMFSMEMLKALGIFLLALFIPAHVIWFLARGRDEGLPISESYLPGIFDAIFWCAESMGGAAQAQPSRLFARIAAIIWVYIGIVLIAYFTAFATTSLTMQSLRSDINGPKDLAGRTVAVVEGSTSANYVASIKARIANYPNFDAAAAALLAGKAEAVVYDTPVILFHTKAEPRLVVAGEQFKPESYGIIFPLNSSLRLPVNRALLKLIENGTYEELNHKWFGQN